MIGLGTQDDLEQANEFADTFDITHTLLWDQSFQSWAQLGVSLQPSAKLYDTDGALLAEWLGPFDEDDVLELIDGNQVAAAAGAGATVDRFCRYVDRLSRAQSDAVAYPTVADDQQQRILDDLRYAANALAQTAPSELAVLSEQLAAAVRAHSQVLLDADLPVDPSGAEGYDESAAALDSAIAANIAPLNDTCGVMLQPDATP
ncbi:MAG: hypothetical protein WKF60_03770 [Ilumatobacter sp.]